MKFLVALSFLFSISISAEVINCKDGVGQFGNFSNMRYQISFFESSQKCFISIGPNNRYPLYRSFNFDSKGELMIFNSLGDGRPSENTGARNYLFPVLKSSLKYELDSENEFIRVHTTDGRVWSFDARSSKIHNITKMDFVEDPDVNRTNNGGLELSPKEGHLIDEGWRLGGPPNIILKRKSIVKDSFGNKCSVKNKKLFKHDLDSRGRVNGAYFIHQNEADWKKFLKINCTHFGL